MTAMMMELHLSSPVEKGLLIFLCKGMVSWKNTLERGSSYLPGNWTSFVNKLVKSVYHVCKVCYCKNCSLWQQVIIFLCVWQWCKTCSAFVVYLVFHYHSSGDGTTEWLHSQVNTGLISFINYHGEEMSFMHNSEKCPSPSVKWMTCFKWNMALQSSDIQMALKSRILWFKSVTSQL